MDSLLLNKIGALTTMFILAFLSGTLPIKLRKILMNNSTVPEKYTLVFLSASLCFGAGVLMSTVFLHILKETRETYTKAVQKKVFPDSEYAIPELLICAGFFTIYFLEELVHICVRRHKKSPGGESKLSGKRCKRRRSSGSCRRNSRHRCNSVNSNAGEIICRESKGDIDHHNLHNSLEQKNYVKDDRPCVGNNNYVGQIGDENEDCCEQEYKGESLVRTIIVILSLSLHGTFEGLSLGLEENSGNVWLLCVALSSHKIFIAFSIGMELLEEQINFILFLVNMSIFAVASPLGGIIALSFKASLNDDHFGLITILILKGITGGTILYVTFCEVLERERSKPDGRFIKFWALLVGFCVVAALEAGTAKYGEFDHLYQFNNTNKTDNG